VERTFNITRKNIRGGYYAETDNALAAEIVEMRKEIKKLTTPLQNNTNLSCPLCYATNPNHTAENCPNRSMNRKFNIGTYCNICRSREHSAQYCPKKNSNTQNSVCFKCQGKGHFAKECPLTYQNNGCFNCGRRGHSAKDCRQSMKCSNCGRNGHVLKDCRASRNQYDQRNTSEIGKCVKCGNPGHTKEKCNARTCDFCHQIGHLKKDCFALQRELADYQKNTQNKFNNKTFLASNQEQEQSEEMSEHITATIKDSIAEMFKKLNLKD
jgi:hypothetical protein